MISGILLTHGPIATAIAKAAGSILGKVDKIVTVSTSGFSLNGLVEKLEELIIAEKLDQGIIFMTSLKGGTCWNAAVAIARKFDRVEIVSGVNLNMFISFVTKRSQFDLSELADIIMRDAIRGIDHVSANSLKTK